MDFCWIARVSRVPQLERVAKRFIDDAIAVARDSPLNPIVVGYLADPASASCARLFTVSGTGSLDIFRDVIVLKAATTSEKGVILLKYARTFEAVQAIFDVPKLLERYTFVLEPCWAGYCDPSLLMFVAQAHPVLVQCFTKQDSDFIRQVGPPLVPLDLGPADWVDADLFKPERDRNKTHDLVMVANWAKHKRHSLLFRAIERVRGRDVSVLLIGFPLAGRVMADVKREAASIVNRGIRVDFLERIPARSVAGHVSGCRAFVFLSRKEGDNKALVEAMFADVPSIVYKHTVGGASRRINEATGMLVEDADLPAAIVSVLDDPHRFSPRAWALANTGSRIATRVVDDALRRAAFGQGQPYTTSIVEKTNAPNLAYRDEADRARFAADYAFIHECRRMQAPLAPAGRV